MKNRAAKYAEARLVLGDAAAPYDLYSNAQRHSYEGIFMNLTYLDESSVLIPDSLFIATNSEAGSGASWDLWNPIVLSMDRLFSNK